MRSASHTSVHTSHVYSPARLVRRGFVKYKYNRSLHQLPPASLSLRLARLLIELTIIRSVLLTLVQGSHPTTLRHANLPADELVLRGIIP